MTLPSGIVLRPATVQDAPLIQAQRDAMFTDMGREAALVQAVSAASLAWLQVALAAGSYAGVLAVDAEGQVLAGAGASWLHPCPSPAAPSGRRAYLDNVYVVPEARGQRLAGRLVDHLLDESRRRGVRLVSLHTSDAGRATYAALGFAPTQEMHLFLDEQP